MLGHKYLIVLLVLCLGVVLVTGCLTAEPETVEVEVPVEVEVTRIVEVMVEAAPAEAVAAPSVFPGLDTEVRTYRSQNGRDYTAYVVLPLGYGMEEQSYPVVYVTDGDFYTISTSMSAAQLFFGGEMPPVITVGIGYGGSAMDSLERREQDMNIDVSESFLQFIEEELIPDIEANYAVDPSLRTLVGHSLGGEFSLYALFNAPETFGNIIASSPYYSEAFAALESTYAEGHDTLPVRLYASVGDREADLLPGMTVLGEALQVSDYGDLVSELAVLEGETHVSAQQRAFTSGMQWAFGGEGG